MYVCNMKKIHLFILLLIPFLSIHAQKSNSIGDSNNVFALKLYSQLSKENKGNLFFSPFSISTALAMTYAGARDETETQMSQTLHFNPDQSEFHTDYKNYIGQIEADTGKRLKMEIANSIWLDNSFKLLIPYQDIVKDDYNSLSKNVDFKHAAEPARKEINKWVEKKTHDKIIELIKPGMIDGSTKLVLVNAIYFDGKWSIAFSKDSTKKDLFILMVLPK